MLKVQIKNKQNEVTHAAKFDTQAEVDAWKAQCEAVSAWGKPERWVIDSPMSPLSEEEKAKSKTNRVVELSPEVPESKDEDGNVIPAIPAVLGTEYYFPAEYQVEVTDITAQVEAEKALKVAKEKSKSDRKTAFKAIDWTKTMTVKQLQEVVKSILDHTED